MQYSSTPSDQLPYSGVPGVPDLTDRKIATREQRIKELTDTINGLEASIRQRKADLATLDEQLGERQRRLDESDDIFKQLNDTYIAQENELKTRVQAVKDELAPLEQQVLQWRTEIRQARRNIEVLKKQHTDETAKLTNQLNTLKANIERETADLTTKIQAIRQQHREIAAATAIYEETREEAEQALLAVQQANAAENKQHAAEVAQHTTILNDLRAKAIEARKINNANQKAANDQLAETKQHVTDELRKLTDKEAIVDGKIARLRHLEELEALQKKGKLTGGQLYPQPLQRNPIA